MASLGLVGLLRLGVSATCAPFDATCSPVVFGAVAGVIVLGLGLGLVLGRHGGRTTDPSSAIVSPEFGDIW